MSEKISIALESGETISSNIVSVFMIPDSNKKYIVTTENAVDPHGLTVLHVSEIIDDTLSRVATDDEWSTIKTIMRAIISGNVGTYQYLPLVTEVKADSQYSRDISVSSSASKQMMDSYELGLKQLEEDKAQENEENVVNSSSGSSIFPDESVDANEDNSVVPGIVDVSDEKNTDKKETEETNELNEEEQALEEVKDDKVDDEKTERNDDEEQESEVTEEKIEENKNDESAVAIETEPVNEDPGVLDNADDEDDVEKEQQSNSSDEATIENQEENNFNDDVVNSDLKMQNTEQNPVNNTTTYENQGINNMGSEMVVSMNMNDNQMDLNNGQVDGQVVMQNQEMMGTQPQDMMAMQSQQMVMQNADMMQGAVIPTGPYDELFMEIHEKFAECLKNALEKLSMKENELNVRENELRARENDLFVRDNDLRNREAFLAQKERAINDQMKSMMNNFAMFQQTPVSSYSPMGQPMQPQMQQPMMQQPMVQPMQPQMQQPMMQQQPMVQPMQPQMQQPMVQPMQPQMQQQMMQQPTMVQVPSDENIQQ